MKEEGGLIGLTQDLMLVSCRSRSITSEFESSTGRKTRDSSSRTIKGQSQAYGSTGLVKSLVGVMTDREIHLKRKAQIY